jgi:hypothetical protein
VSLEFNIKYPLLFNPLKHHLGNIKEFISGHVYLQSDIHNKTLHKEIKKLGSSVMDIYTGSLPPGNIFEEIAGFLKSNNLLEKGSFSIWAGTKLKDFRICALSDTSQWTLKYHNSESGYVHLFPARYSPHTFRVKANTLKSALLYLIIIRKTIINEEDLNYVRSVVNLSPVKSLDESEAILELIQILRT